MADESQILDGFFKGVPISIVSSELDGGRKTVIHSYPSRNTQKVEDMGLKPRSFRLDIIIRSDDYFGYRNRLLAVLESDSPGELIHPLYGRMAKMKATTYSLNESLDSFGNAVVSAQFEPDSSTGIPVASGNVVTEVKSAQQSVITAVQVNIEEEFQVTEQFMGNHSAAVDKVNSIINSARESVSFIGEAATDINDFTRQIGEISASVNSLVTDPIALAESVIGLFESVEGLYSSADATFQAAIGFFGFGSDDQPFSQSTAGLMERATNNSVLNGAVNALSLSAAYLSVTEVTVDNVRELDDIVASLDLQYQLVMDSGAGDDVKGLITDQRALALQVIDQNRLTTPQIIDVSTTPTSVRLLSFDYYGSDSTGEDIANLNAISDVSFVVGSVEVLTA